MILGRLSAATAVVAPGGMPPFSPVTLNAAETMAVLGSASTPGVFEGETGDCSPPASATATATLGDTGAGVAEEIENVRQQMQEMERLRRDKRAQRMGTQLVQVDANGATSTRTGASTFKPPRVLHPAATHADEVSTFALDSSSLSSPASPWASEGPSMDYGLQLLEAGLHQQMIQPTHRVNSQPETMQEGRPHGKLAPVPNWEICVVAAQPACSLRAIAAMRPAVTCYAVLSCIARPCRSWVRAGSRRKRH